MKFSIEITPNTNIDNLKTKEVFITWLPTHNIEIILKKVQDVKKMGLIPIPHIPAKKIKSIDEVIFLTNELKKYTNKILLIGGGGKQEGIFNEVNDLVKTGYFTDFEIGVAGFPEGNGNLSYEESLRILNNKKYASFVVTQFCLDLNKINRFLHDSTLPVYLGIPNKCNNKQIIKFSKMCGLSNSLKAFKSNPLNLLKLLIFGFKPNRIINNVSYPVKSFHIYTFGNTYFVLE